MYTHIEAIFANKKLIMCIKLLSVFFISRLMFHLMGLNYDVSNLYFGWQLLDIKILEGDLIKGLYYLHGQPPLFNLFVGCVVKLFPRDYSVVFSYAYHCMSFLLYLCIYNIFFLLSKKQYFSFLLATIFICCPEVLFFENTLSYTLPVALLLVLSLFMIMLYEITQLVRYAALFFILTCIICLMRSAFHLVFVFICFYIIFSISYNKKCIVIYFFISLLMVGSVYIKNYVEFGFFGSSSWIGMNLWRITNGKEDALLYNNGKSVISQSGFIPIDDSIFKNLIIPDKYSKIEVLADKYKRNGAVNFNYYGYMNLSDYYFLKSVKYICENTKKYLSNVFSSFSLYLSTSYYLTRSGKDVSISNYRVISSYGLYFMIIKVFFLFCCLFYIKKSKVGKGYRLVSANKYMVATIIYFSLVCNLMEYGENSRMRAEIDPLIYILVSQGIFF